MAKKMKAAMVAIATLSFCVFVMFNPGAARAQSIAGSISGIVTDPSGAVIPNATVRATALSTNLHYTALTDGSRLLFLFRAACRPIHGHPQPAGLQEVLR